MEPGIFTIVLVALTAITSIKAFSDQKLLNNFIFWPARMKEPRQYYRFISHGLVHLDWMHLIFNMVALYSFGRMVEFFFAARGVPLAYPLLYLSGIVVSSTPSFYKHRQNPYYRSLGASGGVSAILFSAVALNPWSGILIFPIPFEIPGFVFAILYLLFSAYMDRKGGSNVGHDAHFWGGVYGFVFTIIILPGALQGFITQILHPRF